MNSCSQRNIFGLPVLRATSLSAFQRIKNQQSSGSRSVSLRITFAFIRLVKTGGAGQVNPRTCRSAKSEDQIRKCFMTLVLHTIRHSVPSAIKTAIADDLSRYATLYLWSIKRRSTAYSKDYSSAT